MAERSPPEIRAHAPWRASAILLTFVASVDAAFMLCLLAYVSLKNEDVWQIAGTFGLASLVVIGLWRASFKPLPNDQTWDEVGDVRRVTLAAGFMLGAHFLSDEVVHTRKVGEALWALRQDSSTSLNEFHRSVVGTLVEDLQFYFWEGNFTNKGLWTVLALIGAAIVARALSARSRLSVALAIVAAMTATFFLAAQWSSLVVLGQPIDAVEHWPLPENFTGE